MRIYNTTDEEAVGALPREAPTARPCEAPNNSFVAQYALWQYPQGDTPVIYSLLSGLALLAATAPKDLMNYHAAGGPYHANIYGMLVGPSYVVRKSTAISQARRLLNTVDPTRITVAPGSWQQFVVGLAEQPQQLWFVSELGDLLASTAGGGRNARSPLKTKLVDVFDCGPTGHALRKELYRIPDPRVSLLAAVNPAFLLQHAEPADWTGGLFSRFLIVSCSERGRTMNWRTPMAEESHQATEDWLRWRLEQGIQQSAAGIYPCKGFTPEAQEALDEWHASVHARYNLASDDKLIGLMGRSWTHAIRIATLYGWDYGGGREARGPWDIGLHPTRAAIALADLHLRTVEALAPLSKMTQEMRIRQQVVDALHPGEWVALRDVLRRSGLLMTKFQLVLSTLAAEGCLDRRVEGRVELLRLREEGAPPLDDAGIELDPTISPYH